jgi:hypothetical protein
MPRGKPSGGTRKTDAWYRRNGLEPPVRLWRLKQQQPEGVRFALPKGSTAHISTTPLVPVIPAMVPAVVEQPETDEEIDERIRNRFDVLADLTDTVISGECRALFVSGPAGLGKSYTVEQKMMAFDPKERNHMIVKGKTLAPGLYKLLFKFKEKGQILIFDDCDTIFFDDTALNFLKIACDTTERRRLSYFSEGDLYDDDTGKILPKQFEYEGALIFITNYDFDLLIGRGHKLAPHLQAIQSRAHYIDMSMKTARDCVIRIRQVIDPLLAEKKLTDEQKKEVLAFLDNNKHNLREVSLRTALKVADLRRSRRNWETVAKITTCR